VTVFRYISFEIRAQPEALRNRSAPKFQPVKTSGGGLGRLDLLPTLAVGIARGFIASGISRTRLMCRSPFSSVAPVTTTWSASWKLRSKVMPLESVRLGH
jgi:hypothetical protein